jgi:ABC-type branched-subunit amino acid transport system ATPase component
VSGQSLPLRCKNLSKSFDGVRALADVSLEFPRSGVAAIIGPNGAGKTTLLNAITGFLRPDAGKCFLGDRILTGLPAHEIARLGIARTFQDLRLITQVSVLENVLVARPNQRGERLLNALFRFGVAAEEQENRTQAMRWLRFVGLDAIAKDFASELSYGQQRLLSLACCLATDADTLLLDEPVSGIQPNRIEQILNLLRELRDLGKRIVFIEHNIASVRAIADSVIVMDHGRVVAQGKPSDVLERPEIIEAYVG